MRSWVKALGLFAGGLAALGGSLPAAHAQFPPGGMGMPCPDCAPQQPQGNPQEKENPFTLTNDGTPNAFSDLYGIRSRMTPDPMRHHWLGLFHHAPAAGIPADFPNAAVPSCEAASPFTVQEGGMQNGFTELAPACPPSHGWLHAPRLLVPEMFAGEAPQPCWTIGFRSEFLAWNLQKGPLAVPLVTTTNNPNFNSVGQLGDSGTVILLGAGNTVNYDWSPGFRLTGTVALGVLPPIEVSGFSIQRTVHAFSGGSLTNPQQFLALPFQDVNPAFIIPGTNNFGTETSAVVVIPVNSPFGGLGGTIDVTSRISFWGIEVNGMIPLNDADTLHLNMLVGYRHLQLAENLGISTQAGGVVGGTTFNNVVFPAGLLTSTTYDGFATTNNFDGAQIGLRTALTMGRWTLTGDAKIAFGETTQRLDIGGNSTLIQAVPGRPTQSLPGGIFALPTNSAHLSVDHFTVVPETNISLSYQVNHCIRLFGGYNFLYWNQVARPGDSLNNIIDSRQIPTSVFFTPGLTSYNGPAAPSIYSRSFYAHGVFVGVEFGF
jgi:hypothetical protein